MSGLKSYWGEIHTHTSFSDGQSTPDEAAAEARNHLDFWACADHICASNDLPAWHEKFMQNWDATRQAIAAHNDPGQFVTLLAYEYSSVGGDFNIYFPGDHTEAYLPESVGDFADYAAANDAILIPHHSGYIPGIRGVDWDDFRPDVMPVVEVFSMHGSSEVEPGPFPMNLYWMGPRASAGTCREGLNRGLRFGMIGSSDGHGGYPGNYLMGLACVLAPELTREAIHEGLRARSCYGVTGDRIGLELYVNGEPMGSELRAGAREISFSVEAMDAIRSVEVIKNGRPMPVTLRPSGDTDGFIVRIEWGWGNYEGNRWEGELRVEDGLIANASPNFGSPGPNRIVERSDHHCAWDTHVDMGLSHDWRHCRNGREATQQIVFTVRGHETSRLNVRVRGREFRLFLGDLLRGSVVELVEDDQFGGKVKFHRALPQGACRASGSVTDEPELDVDYYYLRVTQQNGQMAWSSPIWVEG